MRLSQKARGWMSRIEYRDTLTETPPVDRWHPLHYVNVVELGKPVVLPAEWAGRVCKLQSMLWDSG
jgi:hypothetical protein